MQFRTETGLVKCKLSPKQLVLISMFGALLFISQVLLSGLANCELVSLLIIVLTLSYGKNTLYSIFVFVLLEGFQWGFGLWWLSYIYAWPFLYLMVLLFRRFLKNDFILWAVFSGCYGLLFGGLFALPYVLVSPSFAVTYWISGIPWDLWHGVCNFVLCIILGRPLHRLLNFLLNSYFKN